MMSSSGLSIRNKKEVEMKSHLWQGEWSHLLMYDYVSSWITIVIACIVMDDTRCTIFE